MKQNHRYKRLAVLLVLVFTLATVATVSTSTVSAVDLSQPCSLTVVPGSSEYIEDLTSAGLVVDLYRVADAREVSSADSYTYQFVSDFASLEISDSPTNLEWRSLSQKAANIALKSGQAHPVVTGAACDHAIGQTDAGSSLSAGLYLVVVRGQGLKNYMTTVKDEAGKEQIATVAYSEKYTYTFAPELVSLPGKQADANGNVNTANPGEWLYDMSITMKPGQAKRFGSLEIIKTLLSYSATSGPATFVFSVEAVLNGKNVYSDVVSLVFNSPGQKSCLIEKIPVGAMVTVTEVYSGACYTLTTDADQTAVIPANDVVSVSFTNDYAGTNNGGGGITNHFVYNSDFSWKLTKIPSAA